MKTAHLLTLLVAAGLSACSSAPRTPDYPCPLDNVAGAKCASVEQAYSASKSMTKGENNRVQSVFDRRVQQPKGDSTPFFQGQAANYPEPGVTGMPVYQQPKVMRPWVAPYVDADGNLRSGEYAYFATPGRWNYGDLRKPGAAAGIFGPSRAENLGFNPVEEAKTPPKPSVTPSSNLSAVPGFSSSTVGSAPAAKTPTDSTGSITQPYQRLPSN